jgi:hypothetical protein
LPPKTTASGRIPLNATVLAPATVSDPNADNDEANAELLVDGLFRDRFETTVVPLAQF